VTRLALRATLAAHALLDPTLRPGLEATEHFMSWLRFGITAAAAGTALVTFPVARPAVGLWELLVAVAFLYSVPHIFIRPGRPTAWTRLRILLNTVLDFVLAAAAVATSGGAGSPYTWVLGLVIVGNVLRYGEAAGALAVAGSMLALALMTLQGGLAPGAVVPELVARLGFFWVLYLMVAYLSRYATRMEQVAHKGTRLMEAIGRIGVPVKLAGNVAMALQAVCEEIPRLFDVDHVFIWLVHGDEIVGSAATGPARDALLALRRPIADPHLLAARVVRERRPVLVHHLPGAGDHPDAALARAYGLRGAVGIPLIHGEASVGAMVLADSRHPARFRDEDLPPAMLLGNLAATALYHASMHDQLRAAYHRTLETLSEAIDVRDVYTGGHSLRIARHAELIARALGCDEQTREHIRTAALLHDVGKIGIPDSILLKPGRLSEPEMETMRSHSLIGARLLRTAGFPEEVVQIVRHLHEHVDGWGYPGRLAGEAVPLGSRILAVADAYEAMTSHRVYRPAMEPQEAIAELRRCAGAQFDPAVVDAFVRVHEEHLVPAPTGELTAERTAPADIFALMAGGLLDRFAQFAGEELARAIVQRVHSQAERSGWTVTWRPGALDVRADHRHLSPEARRQVLHWVLVDIERLGGRRLALHLLHEVEQALSPEAREAYRGVFAAGTADPLSVLTPTT
jgi:putative nucleotidyltransferase with HDIG domain